MDKRTLVVTGASTGFGRHIAEMAHARGWRVIGTVRKDADADALAAAGITSVRMDLAVPDTIAAGCAEIVALTSGSIDAVVHNAGSTWPGPVELIDLADLRMQFEVNVFGHIDVTQRLMPAVREAKGQMLFISSESTTNVFPMMGPYAASKRAIEALAEALAQETLDQGVTVSVVAPGAYETAIWGTATPRGDALLTSKDPRWVRYRQLGRSIATAAQARKMGDAADLAAVVLAVLENPRPPFRTVAPFATKLQGALRTLAPTRWFHRLAVREILRRGA